MADKSDRCLPNRREVAVQFAVPCHTYEENRKNKVKDFSQRMNRHVSLLWIKHDSASSWNRVAWKPELASQSSKSLRLLTRKLDIQLFRERLSDKKCARGNPERYYGIWSIHFSWHWQCRTYFCCFPLALAPIIPWPLVPFFQLSLKNSEPKSAHNTFRVCCVHFFRQPFSKKLYIQSRLVFLSRCAIHARSTRYANLDMIINLRYARRGINCGRQEKPAILISRLLLHMRRMYVASVRSAFH